MPNPSNKKNNFTNRRDFLKKGSLTAAALLTGGFSACSPESIIKEKQSDVPLTSDEIFEWQATTTWPPNFPVLGEGVVKMAKEIDILSAGRLKITVFGGGELVPALEAFEAVSLGGVQMAHGAAYYWAGRLPASSFFTAVPFGMNAQQMSAWLFYGGGLELWRELYEPYNLIPFPCGNTGVQMGGWFNKEINTPNDLKGLKMRIPGLGGKVISAAGGSAVTVAGGELYTSLERGVVDAAEWIGPYHDYNMGFHRVSKYYYYPGWHEPGSVLELIVNKKAFEKLPLDLQEIVKTAALKYNSLILSEFEAKNNFYLQKILKEAPNVELRQFPKEVLDLLKEKTTEILDEIASKDEFTRRVYESFKTFKKQVKKWGEVSEQSIVDFL
ncbi:MAG: ABC transporter substrate-binding protein [Flexibacter sp. CG_4_10_14_3_um_filter_32_15]|nr:MAG: ABC transporter substrate-binding protein [Flexibacter sp. CG_4_10_14_3_um_filter_32_15]PJB20607.1 MAG: ABC transporter substrate-binding protein [Flavobacteriaceae bacterium CG_4_9_14_3_um_filter_33_16]